MIKKFEIFEKINNVALKTGVYVIMKPHFYRNNIGIIKRIQKNKNTQKNVISIQFLGDDINSQKSKEPDWYRFEIDEILYWSDNIKDLQVIIKGNRFDL